MLAFFNHVQSIIRGYHKDKNTHLLHLYKEYIADDKKPSIIRWYSWKHECKIDEVTYTLHPILFYIAKEKINHVPKSELFDSICYIIKYYPQDSEERFDCLDFLVDITTDTFSLFSIDDKRIAATILNRFGSLDEQLYAERYLRENNYSEMDIPVHTYDANEKNAYDISYIVHSMLFSLSPTERELVCSDLHSESEAFRDFLSFYDVVEEIENRLQLKCTQDSLMKYLF